MCEETENNHSFIFHKRELKLKDVFGGQESKDVEF